jgi:uncharacterized membrane protein
MHPKSSNLSKLEELGVFVTDHVGTMGFFFIILFWTVLWLGWNTLGPKHYRFDPAPAFVLWLFISNLIQIHLMPLIMVGQNVQDKHAELREQYDYETDKKAEKEIEKILTKLDENQKMLQELSRKVAALERK